MHDIGSIMQAIMNGHGSYKHQDGCSTLNTGAGIWLYHLSFLSKGYEIVAGIRINERNGTANNAIVDGLLHAECYSIEQANAWTDEQLQKRITDLKPFSKVGSHEAIWFLF